MLATRLGSQGVRILATMVLARMVSKGDYGRYEMILAVPGLISAAGDFGVTRSIVNNPDLPDDEVRDTALVVMLAMAVILGVVAAGAGWYFDIRLDDPRLRWVGLLIAVSYIVQNVQAVQLALLARELRFVRWAGVEAVTMVATVITGVAVALAGGGIFALVVQNLLSQVLGLAVSLYSRPLTRPRHIRRTAARRFFSFGWKMTLYQYANNVQANLSKLAVGKLGGDVAVGVFGRATQVRDLIGHNLGTTFDLILMPLMARAKDDPARLRSLLLRGTAAVTAFMAFGAVWMAATAPDLVRVVLGSQWDQVPPLLVALAPGLAVSGLVYPNLILALALGDPLVNFAYAVMTLAGLVLATAVYFATDLFGFALTQSLFAVIPAAFAVRWGTRITGLPGRDLLRRVTPTLLLAAAVGGLMWLTRLWLTDALPFVWQGNALATALARLVLTSLVGVGVGWALFAVLDRANYRDLLRLVIHPTAPAAA